MKLWTESTVPGLGIIAHAQCVLVHSFTVDLNSKIVSSGTKLLIKFYLFYIKMNHCTLSWTGESFPHHPFWMRVLRDSLSLEAFRGRLVKVAVDWVGQGIVLFNFSYGGRASSLSGVDPTHVLSSSNHLEDEHSHMRVSRRHNSDHSKSDLHAFWHQLWYLFFVGMIRHVFAGAEKCTLWRKWRLFT